MAKKLLNEATIRRFAKLANISAINENMYEQEEEEMPAEEAPVEMDAEMPEEEPMDDMGAAEELELTDDEAMAIIELGKKLEAAMPAGEEAMEEPPVEMDVEMDAEMPPEEAEEEIMEALKGINYIPGKKEIVEEVARRVAKRLLKAKKAEKQLSEALGNSPRRTKGASRKNK